MKHQNILVTGSSGLIGKQVCRLFDGLGHTVRRFDIKESGADGGDVRSAEELKYVLKGCTGVVHLAAVSRVVWGENDPELCASTNVEGTRNIVEAISSCTKTKPWLIFGSSREVYGQCKILPVTENQPLQPMNHYARSKVAGEQMVSRLIDAGVNASILRFSTVYGDPEDHEDRVVPAFCRAAIRNESLRVDGKFHSLDITHIDDVAKAVIDVARLLDKGRRLSPMHLTTGSPTRLIDLARMAIRIADSESEVLFAPPRIYDVENFHGDHSVATQQIGWRPKVTLELGLANLIDALSDTGCEDRT